MKFQLITREKGLIIESDINMLNTDTLAGSLGILDHHAPMVTVIKTPGIISLKSQDQDAKYQVSNAFLEVASDNSVTVIADTVEQLNLDSE